MFAMHVVHEIRTRHETPLRNANARTRPAEALRSNIRGQAEAPNKINIMHYIPC